MASKAQNLLNRSKAEASRIADHAEATAGGPVIAAAMITKHRKTKGYTAALVAGLTVGALVERGKPEVAEEVTKELALIAVEVR
jgi:hypothetical protein